MVNSESFDYSRLGNTYVGGDGMTYASTLGKDGRWEGTCLDCTQSTAAIIVALLKTMRFVLTNPLSPHVENWKKKQQQAKVRQKNRYNAVVGAWLKYYAKHEPSLPRAERMRLAVLNWREKRRDVPGYYVWQRLPSVAVEQTSVVV